MRHLGVKGHGSHKKTVEDYEQDARWEGDCLIYPSRNTAARKVYILRHGELPSHIYVCHTCDNRQCILDKHHFLGTQADNIADAQAKGHLVRSAASRAKISKSNKGKLLGRKQTPEHTEKCAAAHRGKKRKPFTALHRQHLSEAAQRRYKESK